jgi:chromosome segregation ATPase
MQRELEQDRVSAADLDKTDELPVLNVAEYEASLAAADSGREAVPHDPLEFTWEDARAHVSSLAPEETLRVVDEWIAEQNARDRASQQALAEARSAEADATARVAQLSAEIETVRAGLKVALGRANESEQALVESGAAARTAEARVLALTAELEETQVELRATSARVTALEADLAAAREALTVGRQTQARQAEEIADVGRALGDRDTRVSGLETELAAARLSISESATQIAHHAAAITQLTSENVRLAEAHDRIERARVAAEARSTGYFERIQTHEWHRGLWDGMWRDLDSELADARATIAGNEASLRLEAAAAAELRAALAEARAAIERLEGSERTQATQLRALTEARTQDVGTLEASVADLAARNESLARQIAALTEAAAASASVLAGRERELAESRASVAALEGEVKAVASTAAAHVNRIAELESITVNVGHALQAQTAAADNAAAAAEASSKESRARLVRLEELEAALAAATRSATEQTAKAATAQSVLAEQAAEVAAARERLALLEEEARARSARVDELEKELQHVRSLAEQGDAPRRALELELGQVRSEFAAQTQLLGPLESRCLELALELEKTRGVLEERDRRLQRLERHAATSAQVFGRIKSSLETGVLTTESESPVRGETARPALVPLAGDGQSALVLGRRTTIGRAPDNDLCIANSSVSRHHALVVSCSRGTFIEDQKSVNGVLVNGRRVRQARLVEGDVVSVGEIQYRFTLRATQEHASH